MSDFKWFKNTIRTKGGVWASDDVYFSQHKDGYSAAYLPQYPNKSNKDECIYSAGLVAETSIHIQS
jgi:hypothetical protein